MLMRRATASVSFYTERSSAVLAKVSSKSRLSAVVDARLVDSRMGYNVFIVYYANKGAWHAHKTPHK